VKRDCVDQSGNETEDEPLCPPVEELADFASDRLPSLADKRRIDAHLKECSICRAQVEGLTEMMAVEAGHARPAEDGPPRHIIDMPFVQSVRDVAMYVERTFCCKQLTVKCRLTIVPDFYKQGLLPSGLRPQQYVARVLTIFAEIAPPGQALTLDADTAAFTIIWPGLRSEYRLSDKTLDRRRKGSTKTIDSYLFLACYTIWADTGMQISPTAFSLPLPQARQVRSNLTPERLAAIGDFFAKHPKLKWKTRNEDLLARIAEYLQRNEFPPELILHPAAPGENVPSFVPWPEFFASMASLHPSEWHDLAGIIHRKREQHIQSQFRRKRSAD